MSKTGKAKQQSQKKAEEPESETMQRVWELFKAEQWKECEEFIGE